MKRLIALLILVLIGFYVVWPGWSAYQIAAAIKARDSATLDRKIDFPSVRTTLRPVTEQKIGEIYDTFQAQSGPAAEPAHSCPAGSSCRAGSVAIWADWATSPARWACPGSAAVSPNSRP